MPPAIQIGARVSKGLYQFTMQASDVGVLYPAAQKLIDAGIASPLLQDVTSDMQNNNPQVNVDIDRRRAAILGVTADQVEGSLYDAYGSQAGVDDLHAEQRIPGDHGAAAAVSAGSVGARAAVSQIERREASCRSAPLRDVSRSVGPVTVNHSGPTAVGDDHVQPRAECVARRGDRGDAAARDAARLPSGITTSFSGTAQAFQSTQAGLLVLDRARGLRDLPRARRLYESFVHPITILSGLPFAALGALLALYIFHIQLSVYAFVGIILLIGIVKKNAIMMVDFALEIERIGASAARPNRSCTRRTSAFGRS